MSAFSWRRIAWSAVILSAAWLVVPRADTAQPPPPQQTQTAQPGEAAQPAPQILTAQQDRQTMLDQLKIPASMMRQGPSGSNPQAPNYQNTDESKANPWPHLPEMMVTKSRKPVTTPEIWWKERRPEIVEYFDAEVYGRVPKDVPKVTWEIAPPDDPNAKGRGFGRGGAAPTVPSKTTVLLGKVDNSACPAITVNIRLTLVLPAEAKGPVPVMMDFGGGGGMGQYLAKGWGYASLNPGSIQADSGGARGNNPGLTGGIIGLVNKGQPRKPEDWGSLRAWRATARRRWWRWPTSRASPSA
jgi:hypothetical protein